MKLSNTFIALALALSAIARPLETPGQSESRLVRRIPAKTSGGGNLANLPRLKKRADAVGELSPKYPDDTDRFSSEKNEAFIKLYRDQRNQATADWQGAFRTALEYPFDPAFKAARESLDRLIQVRTVYRAAYRDYRKFEMYRARNNLEGIRDAARKSPKDKKLQGDLAIAKQEAEEAASAAQLQALSHEEEEENAEEDAQLQEILQEGQFRNLGSQTEKFLRLVSQIRGQSNIELARPV